MKTFTTKYDIGSEIYVILKQNIIRTKIEKINISYQGKYNSFDINKGEETVMDGIEIKYLILEPITLGRSECHWYNEKDVYVTKEEVIAAIS